MAALAGTLFLAVVGANLIIDPEEVFGTGFFHALANVNGRYQAITDYEAAASRYDGLLFGSSRGGDIPIEELQRGTDGVTFARLAVNHGQMTDHLPALEYERSVGRVTVGKRGEGPIHARSHGDAGPERWMTL